MNIDASKEELIQELQKLKTKSVIRDELFSRLCDAIKESSIREKELYAIMNGSKAVLGQKGFTESARAIFDHCKDLIGATSGYVALLSDTGEENEVLFLEAGGLSCDVDPELPMPIRGLRSEAYYSNKAVYHNDFMNSEWVDFMPKGHVVLKNVMFAPLVIDEKTVGLIGLANKATDFDDNDAKIATGFGELAAIALQNSQNLDERIATLTSTFMKIEWNCDKLSKTKGFRLEFPEGYQYYSKLGMVNLFRDHGCKTVDFWKTVFYPRLGLNELKSCILSQKYKAHQKNACF
jgi:transcriptional regulator with GAF, ATPase, and Fis domain